MKAKITLLFLLYSLSCTFNSEEERATKIKIRQYNAEGRKVYNQYCANCHGETGIGLRRLIPPVKDSDFISSNSAKAICIIKYGYRNPIVVNGIEFIQPMPDNPQMSSLEIAEIMTFLNNEWNDSADTLFTVKQVNDILDTCLQ